MGRRGPRTALCSGESWIGGEVDDPETGSRVSPSSPESKTTVQNLQRVEDSLTGLDLQKVDSELEACEKRKTEVGDERDMRDSRD